jgi:hypothetical protein
MTENLSDLIKSLLRVLDKNSEDIASVQKILNEDEQNHLKHVSHICEKCILNVNELNDIKIKAAAVSSLTSILENNPRLMNLLREEKEFGQKAVFLDLYALSYGLYKTYYESNTFEDTTERLSILAILSLNGILSDNVVEVDGYLRNELKNFDNSIFTDSSPSDVLLKRNILLFILNLSRRIKDKSDLEQLRENKLRCESLLEKIQISELLKEKFEIEKSIWIMGLANIRYMLAKVSDYLIEGKLGNQENVYSIIGTYSYNSHKLFESLNEDNLFRISKLLNPCLTQLCRNSIWSIADRSPDIKKYFESLLSGDGNFIYSLLPSQRDSILDILTAKRSTVLSMPTSSGKTLLAELYILFNMKILTENEIKPTIAFIVPTNSLLNQTRAKLIHEFKAFNFNIETAIPLFDLDPIEDSMLKVKHIDILISTPEKLDFLIRKDHVALKNLKIVILDEAHNLSDKSRGSKFEFLLATIKQVRPEVRFLLLSPFLKNSVNLSKWLGDTEQDSQSINVEWSGEYMTSDYPLKLSTPPELVINIDEKA